MFEEEQCQKDCEHKKIFLYKNFEMDRIHREVIQVLKIRADRLREKCLVNRLKASSMEEIEISYKQ